MLSGFILAFLFPVIFSQSCYEHATSLRFKPLASGVPHSLIYEPGMSLRIMRSRAFPRIIVEILDSNGEVDRSINNLKIKAEASTRLNTVGSEAQVHRGEAHFTQLMVEGIDATFSLNFTDVPKSLNTVIVNNETRSTFYPLHGNPPLFGAIVTVVPSTNVWAVRFSETRSLITFPGQTFTAVWDQLLPLISLEIINSAYQRTPDDALTVSNLTLVASIINAPQGMRLEGNTQQAIEGFVQFGALRIVVEGTSAATSLEGLQFDLVGFPNIFIKTGAIQIEPTIDNFYIAFESASTSFIFTQGQSFTARDLTPLPVIRVGLRSNTMARSPPLTGLVISARCNCRKDSSLSGYVEGVVDGVATFTNLAFRNVGKDEEPFVLTFTAGNQGQKSVAGKSIFTGIIMVSSLRRPATSIRFLQSATDSLFNEELQSQEVALFFPLLPIRIELLDSANLRDEETPMEVAVSIANEAAELEGTSGDQVKQFSCGVATFESITFKTVKKSMVVRLTFTATALNESAKIAPLTLVTGSLNVESQVQKNFGMRFQPYGVSLFPQPGISSFATVGWALPPIIVELTTSVKMVDSSSNDIGITATAEGALLSNAFFRVSSGVSVFSGLTFVSETAGEYVLTFTAGNEGNAPVAGKTLVTGAIRVVSTPTPAFGIKFGNNSFVAYEGHIAPITLGEKIPAIVVQLVSSTHQAANQSTSGSELTVGASLSAGTMSAGTVVKSLATGFAVFDDIVITNAFDPVLTFCVQSSSLLTLSEAEGRCISTGALPTRQIYQLAILDKAVAQVPVTVSSARTPISLYSGSSMRIAIGLLDAKGKLFTELSDSLEIQVDSSVALHPPLSANVNRSTGVAYFSNLRFASDFPASVMPILTFSSASARSVLSVLPITTGLITAIGSAADKAGVDVVAEILFDYRTFDFDAWRSRLCARLNIEPERVAPRRTADGTSTDALQSESGAGLNEDNINQNTPSWRGTRVEFRFLEPLPTSRNTKKAAELTDLFLALRTNYEAIADLFLRRTYLLTIDKSCDWFIFDDQQSGARACIETQGAAGYCQCYVPMFEFMGMRCLGYERLTRLCLDTLISQAQCAQPEIREVCRLLEFPDAPRAALAASGAFLFLFLPPLAYLYSNGFFHKMTRPRAGKNRFVKMEYVARDEEDML